MTSRFVFLFCGTILFVPVTFALPVQDDPVIAIFNQESVKVGGDDFESLGRGYCVDDSNQVMPNYQKYTGTSGSLDQCKQYCQELSGCVGLSYAQHHSVGSGLCQLHGASKGPDASWDVHAATSPATKITKATGPSNYECVVNLKPKQGFNLMDSPTTGACRHTSVDDKGQNGQDFTKMPKVTNAECYYKCAASETCLAYEIWVGRDYCELWNVLPRYTDNRKWSAQYECYQKSPVIKTFKAHHGPGNSFPTCLRPGFGEVALKYGRRDHYYNACTPHHRGGWINKGHLMAVDKSCCASGQVRCTGTSGKYTWGDGANKNIGDASSPYACMWDFQCV